MFASGNAGPGAASIFRAAPSVAVVFRNRRRLEFSVISFSLGAHRAELRSSGFPESSTRLSARASGSIPRRVSLGLVITKPIPTVAGDPVQIVHNNPIVNRQLAQKPAIAGHASTVGIDKTELTLFDTKDGNIRECAHRKVPQFLPLYLARWIPCRAQDNLVERHFHV